MVENARQPDIELTMFSQARLLAPVRTMVGIFAQRLGFSEVMCGQMSLAIDEALCNIINHGYDRKPDGRIELRIWDLQNTPPGLKIVIEDRARQVDPATIQPRNLEDIRPGGLGTFIIREIMDEVVYEQRDGGGMRLSLTKQLAEDNMDSSKSKSTNAANLSCETKEDMTDPEEIAVLRETSGDATILRPIGEIDLSRATALRTHLNQALADRPARLIVDLDQVPYMDSSGVATFVEAMQIARRSGSQLILCGLQQRVLSIFEIARLDMVFTILSNTDEALSAS